MERKNIIERNYGIDLLRLLSMFFIIILHALGKGGLLTATIPGSGQYKLVWFLELVALCAVNIFALISGYVSYSDKEKEHKYKNYVNLWFEVVFYGLLMASIYNIFAPGIVQLKDYFYILFPVTNKLYWYFTAYTGLFFLIPFLNNAIRNTDKDSLKKLLIILIVLFSLIDHFTNIFVLGYGYSLIWLIILYIIGAIIKKCEIGKNMKIQHILLGILFLTILSYSYKMFLFDKISVFKTIPISYTSPTMLGISIFYLIGFSKIKFGEVMKKIIKFAAPSAFAIYLLNNQKFFWMNTMKNLFVPLANSSLLIIFLSVIAFAIAFVIGGVLIDKLRIIIFKTCLIDEVSEKIVNFVRKVINKLCSIKERN